MKAQLDLTIIVVLSPQAKFDQVYDEEQEAEGGGAYYDDLKKEVSEQAEANRAEFIGLREEIRVKYEGVRPGCYVRMEIQGKICHTISLCPTAPCPLVGVPCEFVENFDPQYPVIVGELLAGEEQLGYMKVRVKKHRWHRRVLKSCDPLILSVGWRRVQVTPVYCVEEHNMRQRMLKYTPEHMHCVASLYGELTTLYSTGEHTSVSLSLSQAP